MIVSLCVTLGVGLKHRGFIRLQRQQAPQCIPGPLCAVGFQGLTQGKQQNYRCCFPGLTDGHGTDGRDTHEQINGHSARDDEGAQALEENRGADHDHRREQHSLDQCGPEGGTWKRGGDDQGEGGEGKLRAALSGEKTQKTAQPEQFRAWRLPWCGAVSDLVAEDFDPDLDLVPGCRTSGLQSFSREVDADRGDPRDGAHGLLDGLGTTAAVHSLDLQAQGRRNGGIHRHQLLESPAFPDSEEQCCTLKMTSRSRPAALQVRPGDCPGPEPRSLPPWAGPGRPGPGAREERLPCAPAG